MIQSREKLPVCVSGLSGFQALRHGEGISQKLWFYIPKVYKLAVF